MKPLSEVAPCLLVIQIQIQAVCLKCAQGVKRASCVVSHKRIEPKKFFSDNKYTQKIFCRYKISIWTAFSTGNF